jgi:hypothetical protein
MSEPVRADIRSFENLQSQAHEYMGLSELGVFNEGVLQNVSDNVKGILTRLPKFKIHYDNIADVSSGIERLQSKKTTHPVNTAAYESMIEQKRALLQRTRGHFITEAKNIAALIDLESRRLGFRYRPGTSVSKEGLDAAAFAERKSFADAVNAFHTGKLPDGTPFTDFLK